MPEVTGTEASALDIPYVFSHMTHAHFEWEMGCVQFPQLLACCLVLSRCLYGYSLLSAWEDLETLGDKALGQAEGDARLS